MSGLRKKTKDLSASEREERGHGKGVGVYSTLMKSDTVQSYGRAKEVTRPVDVHESVVCTYVVCSRKVTHHV